MELTTESRPARTIKQGTTVFDLEADKHLKIETTPGGEEILDAVVPTGKSWNVVIGVTIQET